MAVKRLDPKPSTVRQLIIASAGICAMPGCNTLLVSPTRGWIGTISHIVAAEDSGPRTDPDMSPENRRSYENLVLFCANHGREVDDRETGERNYPVERLKKIKADHERRIEDLIEQAITSEVERASKVIAPQDNHNVTFLHNEGSVEGSTFTMTYNAKS